MKKPLCISCKHHSGTTTHWCNIPTRYSPVDGSPIRWLCEDQRGFAGKCKAEGLLFDPIPGESIQYADEPIVEGSAF